jgi:hypothetical protein
MHEESIEVGKLISGILDRIAADEREQLYKRWRPTMEGDQVETGVDSISWLKGGGSDLATQILRHVDLTNEEVRTLVQLGVIKLEHPKAKPKLQARLTAFSGGIRPNTVGVPLDQLTVMSAMILELSLDVATALEPFMQEGEQPEELRPPFVNVGAGSIQFTMGGPLLASGLGMAVAASANMLASPHAIPAAVVLATAGVIDLAVSWWKCIGEGKKARAEAAKTVIDTLTKDEAEIKRALDRRQQELAIRKAEMELAAMSVAPSAPSSLIPPEDVRIQAEMWGLSEPASTHLLNRSLEKTITARRLLGPMDAVPVGNDESRRKSVRK